ncbi:MAG TPA: ChbG/HpnK family deacetylase [Candidatus Limnocylindria bacterium]|nr:ChbG/HpnK family deacetylase [Candidatus Limnocylindria bacterium]
MRRLIVNADDFGRARGVNAGILRAHREGIVTAATLMVSAPATDDAAHAARTSPSLDVGVHLTLTYGRPISDPATVPSLVERDGSFPRVPGAFLGTDRADRDEALIEYRAQFARAHALLGRAPTHLDSHHWLHEEPALEWAVITLARETGAAVRPHDDAQRDRLLQSGIRTVDRYRRDFQHEGHVDIPTLERILADIGDGVTELGCHPGELDAELARTSTYSSLRADELATLTDPRIKTAIARNAITLSGYDAVR